MRERLGRVRLLRRLYYQFRLPLYLVIAALLVLFGISKHPAIMRVRIEVANFSSAVVSILYKPVEGITYAWNYAADYVNVRDENIRLKEENQKLLYFVNQVDLLSKENQKLKTQLNFVVPAPYRYWTGYISADNGGVFSRSVLLNIGRKDGIQRGFSVLYNDGLLGRIEAVGHSTSQVLLLTDYASKVPVLVGKSSFPAIVEGDNAPLLKLTLLPEDAAVSVGDYISTSGQGGVYPRGIAVGTICAIKKDGIYVCPFVSREDTQFVKVIDFNQSGLLDVEECNCKTEEKAKTNE